MNRYVSTTFWDDEWIQELDFVAKGLYLYLITNSLTNIAGVYKLSQRRIVFDTGLDNATIEKAMLDFEKAGKVYRWKDYIILPNWCKYQKVENKNIQRGIERLLQDFDRELLIFLKKIGYKYPVDDFITAKGGFDEIAEKIEQPVALEKQPVAAEEQPEVVEYYLKCWRESKDNRGRNVFPIITSLEKPKEWARFWREQKVDKEEITRAFKNFVDGINSGVIPRQFIPPSPDRFVLKGGLQRYSEPVRAMEKQGDCLSGKISL